MNRVPASDEHGFALIEAIVSAAVLALIAVAILAGIDGATSSAGREKARAIAASFAERDQERMRAMQVEELASYAWERSVPDGDGSQYTIKSESRWVRDDTGATPSCTNNQRESDYLRIQTTVSAPGVRGLQPVEITSLVAPSVAYSSSRGSLAVKVTNRDGLPVRNLAVSISGASSDQAPTNDDGCALFEYIPVGSYTAQLNTPGWVDHWGNGIARATIGVTSGNLNVLPMTYDDSGEVTVSFTTTKPGTAQVLPSLGRAASATNGEKPGLRRVFTSTLPVARDLFPFRTPYAFYAGGCRESDPTVANPANPDYFLSNPGLAATVALDRGGVGTVSVRQPPLSLRVVNRRATAWVNGAEVWARLKTPLDDDGTRCREVVKMVTRDNPYRSTTNNAHVGWASRETAAFDSGLPFGSYDICVQYYDTGDREYHRKIGTYDNTLPTGQPDGTYGSAAMFRADDDDRRCPSW